jgi:Protein of unknown function (DUF2589)
VVDAQQKAGFSTINFIREVGFDTNNQVVSIQFNYNTTNTTTGARVENTIKVPLLTVVPIPYLRVRCLAVCKPRRIHLCICASLNLQIKSVVLNFNGKVNSVTETRRASLGFQFADLSDSQYQNNLLGSVWSSKSSCKGSFANQEEKADSKDVREFSLKVTVKASQAEQPLGMARIMSVLEAAVATGTRSSSA